MNRNYLKSILFITLCILAFTLISACQKNTIIPNTEDLNSDNISKESYLIVKGNPDIIKDCTPEFNIFTEKENTTYMSFSGNGENWSEWVEYNESYDQFNIASGFDGTTMDSGSKTVYVRFRDKDGNIFPLDYQEPVYCTFEYEMQKLFSICIDPAEVEIKAGESQNFMLRGYDLILNEVPLDTEKIFWTKDCGVGELNPISGLKTTYTPPEMPGIRNISAHYGSLGTGAIIYITEYQE
jgi:hypothetical protein